MGKTTIRHRRPRQWWAQQWRPISWRAGRWLLGLTLLVTAGTTLAAEPVVKVGVLQFGTVNWELAAMQHAGLDTANGVKVEVVPYAGNDATRVALLGGAVDIIVSDWLWVSRERAEGRTFALTPYSTSVGAIMVPEDSPVQSAGDLKGLKIGVAGGPLDKSWLLLQGYAKREHQLDLAAANEIVFGAPPLLAEKLGSGELDAMLNYWHYNARAEADGFRPVISAEQASVALGATGPVASIGYVFDDTWAQANPEQIAGFIQASRDTKTLLGESDEEWQRLADSGVIQDGPEALIVLRDRYRQGIPARPLKAEIRDAEVIYQLLEDLGGEELLGPSRVLVDGTYWEGAGADPG